MSSSTRIGPQSSHGDRAATDPRPRIAWQVARGIVAAVFCGYGLIDLLTFALTEPGVGAIVLAVCCLVALLWLQLGYFSRPGVNLRSRLGYALLIPQACLVYLPLLKFGQAWVGLPGFLAGAVLLVLPATAAWTAYAAVVGSMAWIQGMLNTSMLDMVYTTLGVGLYGLEVYVLTRLAAMTVELHTARSELAHRAVSEERLRFARDLHDLLGLSLSAITLKGELAHRLVHSNPRRATAELTEVVEMARQALADVRSVASGYRDLSLEQEVKSAESLLEASNVDVRLTVDRRLPDSVRTVIGAALREGVTNVLQHSKAERCEISVVRDGGTVLLDIVNDGVSEDTPSGRAPEDGAHRTGIKNLTERLADLDGRLTTGMRPDGRFGLHVEVPLPGSADGGQSLLPLGPRPMPQVDTISLPVLLTVVLSGFCLLAAIHLLYQPLAPWLLVSGAVYLAALLVLQLAYFNRPTARLHSRTGRTLLAVQACLVYLPLLQFHQYWVSLPGFLGGTALLVLRPRAGVPVFVLTVASVVAAHMAFTGQPLDVAFNGVSTLISGFVVFGVPWQAGLVAELDTARTELARTAVADERLRFARDLHDLLGLGLSAITLKSELAVRLLVADPDHAKDELVDVLGLARQALSEVRSVAGGYRELSLETEVRSTRSVLTAADIDVRMDVTDVTDQQLAPHVDTALAVVLREGVTNVLRHSDANHCEIVLRRQGDRARLDVVNDGVRSDGRGQAGGRTADETGDEAAVVVRSTGIRNLSERVGRVGGELGTGLDPDGRFRLWATLPATRG